MNYSGWAIYVDCDVLALSDISELWKLADNQYAVMCAKHDYTTKTHTKFLNNSNSNYPKKNWSSVMLINCRHDKNKQLTPDSVAKHSGEYLHQFQWLDELDIGSISKEWNWLVGEYPKNDKAKLLHYTLGAPCFVSTDSDNEWNRELEISQYFLQ
jgi:lipopolysaccharide biosynthesis glycosyltransferase